MIPMDELFAAYEDGDITRGQLFVHLIADLTLDLVRPAKTLLMEHDCREDFEAWLDDIAAGASVYVGGEIVPLSREARVAIARWRAETQTARYARLAGLVERWSTVQHDVERAVEPGEIPPFFSNEVDGLLPEAA